MSAPVKIPKGWRLMNVGEQHDGNNRYHDSAGWQVSNRRKGSFVTKEDILSEMFYLRRVAKKKGGRK